MNDTARSRSGHVIASESTGAFRLLWFPRRSVRQSSRLAGVDAVLNPSDEPAMSARVRCGIRVVPMALLVQSCVSAGVVA